MNAEEILSRGTVTIPFVEHDLSNGLHLILAENHSVPLVALNVWYHVGSKDEDPSRTGLAHLFEHMMFQGSTNVKKTEHFKHIQRAGGTLNATTNQDRTNYFETLPASELELALWLESDRMLSLDVTNESFENQRAVVKEERRQRYENRPYGLVYENLLSNTFPTSGYKWPTIGSMQHLDETTIDEVRAFHKKFYLPNNASLSVAGDFEPSEAIDLIEKYFGGIPAGSNVMRTSQIVAPLTRPASATIEDSVELPALAIAFQGAPAYTREAVVLELVAGILGTGRSSKLYDTVVYRKQIAKEIFAYHASNELSGLFIVQATLQPGVDATEVEKAMWEVLDVMRTRVVEVRELEKAQNRVEARFIRSLEELAHRADRLQHAYTFTKRAENFAAELEILRTIEPEELRIAAAAILDPDRAVTLTVVPKAQRAEGHRFPVELPTRPARSQ